MICVSPLTAAQNAIKDKNRDGCAGRTPIGGSKSEGRREACRVLGANVAQLRRSQVVGELTALYQASVCSRKPQLLAREAKHGLRARCWALAVRSCSCNIRDYDSLACKASKRSSAYSGGRQIRRTNSRQAGKQATHPAPRPKMSPGESSHSKSMANSHVSQRERVTDRVICVFHGPVTLGRTIPVDN